ncbi:hypothetical protein COOONC_08895 [Cooperia oncophora]
MSYLVESAEEISHLYRKLAEVKRKQGFEDTHKINYPIKHHSIKHIEVLPMISDYHSVNQERSRSRPKRMEKDEPNKDNVLQSAIAHHPVHGFLHEKPLSKVALSDLMNLHGGVQHLHGGRR